MYKDDGTALGKGGGFFVYNYVKKMIKGQDLFKTCLALNLSLRSSFVSVQ